MRPTRSRTFVLLWMTCSLFAFVALGTPLLLVMRYKTWANPIGITLIVVGSSVAGFGLVCSLRLRSTYQRGFPVMTRSPGERKAK